MALTPGARAPNRCCGVPSSRMRSTFVIICVWSSRSKLEPGCIIVSMPGMKATRFATNGEELRPGLRVPVPTNAGAVQFNLFAVCDEVPDKWHGEVRFGAEILIRTEVVSTEEAAGRLA